MANRNDYTNIGVASEVAIAADEDVARAGVSSEGCINLMGAMWQLVRKDLEGGLRDTRAWLTSPEFIEWCAACGIEPATLRAHLIDNHWRVRAA